MNRNATSHFAELPKINMRRSVMDLSSNAKTTMNAGELIIDETWELLPGDTFEITPKFLARETTLLHPVMDSAFLDYYFFAVPRRLLWEHWKQFFGESDAAWLQPVEYTIPSFISGTVQKGSAADHLGVPPGTYTEDLSVNVDAMYGRGLIQIWNDWFRDVNNQPAAYFPRGDAATTFGSLSDDFYTDGYRLGVNPPVNKYQDYFTTCLPSPQRGDAVTIPLGVEDLAPVITGDSHGKASYGITFVDNIERDPIVNSYLSTDSTGLLSQDDNMELTASPGVEAVPDNLYADLNRANFGISVIDLRNAFQMQKALERSARFGNRYTEYINGAFGVQSSDSRLQRSEYIGGGRVRLGIQQVVQTSATGATGTPQGNLAAYGVTSEVGSKIVYSSEEHMILYCVVCIRNRNSYQQGINRCLTRQSKYDFYDPIFANLSERPTYKYEIFAGARKDLVFGYQEYAAEYRYKPDRVSGDFRQVSSASIGYSNWHYADFYESAPTLSDDWIRSSPVNIDRTIVVDHTEAPQFLLDSHFAVKATRVMPVYSVPGLIDHH